MEEKEISAKMNVTDVTWKTAVVSPFGSVYKKNELSIHYMKDKEDFQYQLVSLSGADGAQDDPEWIWSVNYKQNDVSGKIMFLLETTDIPVGCYVAFSCRKKGPEPPILLEKSEIQQGGASFNVDSEVPGNFSGPIELSFWSDGKKLKQAGLLRFSAYHMPEEGEDNIPKATLLCKVEMKVR
jgi:hypothetical protein